MSGQVKLLPWGGQARRLCMRHTRTHNGHPRDGDNGDPDSGRLFNFGEHRHS
jgi:hypothetical protein